MGLDGGQTRPDEPCTRVQQGTVSQCDLAGLQNVKTLGSSTPNEAARAIICCSNGVGLIPCANIEQTLTTFMLVRLVRVRTSAFHDQSFFLSKCS